MNPLIIFGKKIVEIFTGGEEVSESNGLPVKIVSPLETSGAIPVNIQDQASEIIDLYLGKHISDVVLNQALAVDENIAIVTSDIAPSAGDNLCLKEETAFYQGNILTVEGTNPYTITLDNPFDFAFSVNGGCSIQDINFANADGSETPVIYSVTPQGLNAGTTWDIVRIMFYISSTDEMDDGLFGSIDSLTKGIVFRKKDGVYKNIFNIKNNGDFVKENYDRQYSEQAKPPTGTLYSVASRRTFGGQNKNGVVVRLEGDSLDELQAIIQDDLTELLTSNGSMKVKVQGHVNES